MADLYSDKNAFSSLWYDENKKREMIFAYVTPGQMMIREKCYLCERRPIEIWTPRYKVNNFFLCTVMHYS